MALNIIVPPTEEPITLAEAKLHCRVDVDDDDLLIGALITAAREQAEHRTGRALCEQTLELVLDGFGELGTLPRPPAIALTSVKYLDLVGAQQTLGSPGYVFDGDSAPARLVPAVGQTWPATLAVPAAVRIRYTAGYGAAADVPQSIKNWMLLTVGALYANREALVLDNLAEMPRNLWDSLLDPYRIWSY